MLDARTLYPAIINPFAGVVKLGALGARYLRARTPLVHSCRIKVRPDRWPPVPGSLVLGEMANCAHHEISTYQSLSRLDASLPFVKMDVAGVAHRDNAQKHITRHHNERP